MASVWRQPQDPWTAYWRAGNAASLSEGGEFSEALDPHWLCFFSELAGGARILDLATGNGAVTRLARVTAERNRVCFEITGVDAAYVRVRAPTPRDAAAPFVAGGIRIETLPYRPAFFDVVTSQFGFEYACELDAARELARVLKPEGRTRLILHARDGAVFSSISVRLDRLGRITVKSGLIDAILYGAAARLASDSDGETLADMTIANQRDVLASLVEDAPPEDSALFYARGLVGLWRNRHRYAATELQDSVSDACARIRAQAERLSAMLEAAHSAESIHTLRAALSYSGVESSLPQAITDRNGVKIAWLLDGVRRGE